MSPRHLREHINQVHIMVNAPLSGVWDDCMLEAPAAIPGPNPSNWRSAEGGLRRPDSDVGRKAASIPAPRAACTHHDSGGPSIGQLIRRTGMMLWTSTVTQCHWLRRNQTSCTCSVRSVAASTAQRRLEASMRVAALGRTERSRPRDDARMLASTPAALELHSQSKK